MGISTGMANLFNMPGLIVHRLSFFAGTFGPVEKYKAMFDAALQSISVRKNNRNLTVHVWFSLGEFIRQHGQTEASRADVAGISEPQKIEEIEKIIRCKILEVEMATPCRSWS